MPAPAGKLPRREGFAMSSTSRQCMKWPLLFVVAVGCSANGAHGNPVAEGDSGARADVADTTTTTSPPPEDGFVVDSLAAPEVDADGCKDVPPPTDAGGVSV